MASLGTALVCLKSSVLVFYDDTLYIYSDSLTEQPSPASATASPEQPDNASSETLAPPKGQPFQLYSLDLLAVSNNLLLCQPTADTLAVFQFDADKDTGALLPPVLVAEYTVPDDSKISVACWDTDHQIALLGTRDGTILRLDLQDPSALHPLAIDGSSSTLLQSSTISGIAVAPCGEGVYAIGYASGYISIVQYSPAANGLVTLHSIEGSKKIMALSWHYSSRNKSSQSLASLCSGSDRLYIYTVNVSDDPAPPRKIRDIPLPSGQSIPSICSKSLEWAKGGKVARVSDSGLVVSDVRTKRVSTRHIPLPPPVLAVDVKSTKGKAWTIDSGNEIKAINLMDGTVLHSTTLPFSLALDSTILDSPIVYIHKPRQINTVTYKNKRAMRSPLSKTEFPPTRPSSDIHAGAWSVSSPEEKNGPSRHKKSGSMPSSTINASFSSPPTASIQTYKPIKLSMQPVKTAVSSLFPSVIKTLNRIPAHQSVPEFFPSLSTREQYALSAIFGASFDKTLCLGGITDILQSCIAKDPGSFKSLIFSLLLSDIQVGQLVSSLGKLSGEKRYSDRFVFSLLSIGNVDNTVDSYAGSFTNSSLDGSGQHSNYNVALVNLVQELIDSYDELPSEDVHLICSYMVSLGYYLEARQVFMKSDFYLEAFVVSLLGRLEFVSVFRHWCLHLQSIGLYPNLLHYLTEISFNISGGPRHSTASTNSSTLDEPFSDDHLFVSNRNTAYSLSNNTPKSTLSDEVAIFSPDLGSGEFPHTTNNDMSSSPASISSNRLMVVPTAASATPKSATPPARHHKHTYSNFSSISPSSTTGSESPAIPQLTRVNISHNK